MQTDASFELRVLTPQDWEAVLAVYQQCEDFLALGPHPHASREMVLSDMALSQRDGGVFCGIYLPQEGLVGVVDYIPHHFEGRAEHAFLSLLMIAAPFRQRGLGQAVTARVEAAIKQNAGVTAILSAVQVNAPQSIRFWQRNGYRIVSGPELQPDQTTTFRLYKELS